MPASAPLPRQRPGLLLAENAWLAPCRLRILRAWLRSLLTQGAMVEARALAELQEPDRRSPMRSASGNGGKLTARGEVLWLIFIGVLRSRQLGRVRPQARLRRCRDGQ